MLRYQAQSSEQTLREGLEEYRVSFANQLASRSFSVGSDVSEAAAFFACHDAVHVVWGCGLSLEDEIVVKINSLLGTTRPQLVWRGYNLAEAKEIYEEIGVGQIAAMLAKSIVLVPLSVFRSLRMREKWPWDDFEPLLDCRLVHIRGRFGIQTRGSGA